MGGEVIITQTKIKIIKTWRIPNPEEEQGQDNEVKLIVTTQTIEAQFKKNIKFTQM